jgi:site-specific DNA-methyltransferase (adenine-specific)
MINKIFNEDCLKTMAKIPNDFIDLTITSPPYDNLRDYKNYKSFNFSEIAKEIYRITKNGGIVVWIVGDSVVKKSKTLTSFKQALEFKEIGFNMHDVMIYQKNAYPFPPVNRYFQVFEYMFILSKGVPKTTNIQMQKTISQKKKKDKSTKRQKDGSLLPNKYEQGKDIRKMDNVWKMECGYMKSAKDKIAYKHPAIFPEELVNRHIISWSNENDLIYDPFIGSGTTAKMAILNNRKFIGSEISEEYYKIANERLELIKEDFIDGSN